MFPRWKAAVAAVLAAILAWSGALALVGWYQPAQQADLPVQSVELPILMYHHIHKSSSQWGDHVVSPQTLEGDFQYLTAQGYTAVTVADLTAYTQNGTPLPKKPIMITFDDGQLSVLKYALPLLERYDLKAVVAVVGTFADEYTQSKAHRERTGGDGQPYLRYAQPEKAPGLPEEGRGELVPVPSGAGGGF